MKLSHSYTTQLLNFPVGYIQTQMWMNSTFLITSRNYFTKFIILCYLKNYLALFFLVAHVLQVNKERISRTKDAESTFCARGKLLNCGN